jgi:hypothetical protein
MVVHQLPGFKLSYIVVQVFVSLSKVLIILIKKITPKCEVLVLSIKDPFWVLANTKTPKVTLYHFNYIFTPRCEVFGF